jgi:chromosome segregation ATPase
VTCTAYEAQALSMEHRPNESELTADSCLNNSLQSGRDNAPGKKNNAPFQNDYPKNILQIINSSRTSRRALQDIHRNLAQAKPLDRKRLRSDQVQAPEKSAQYTSNNARLRSELGEAESAQALSESKPEPKDRRSAQSLEHDKCFLEQETDCRDQEIATLQQQSEQQHSRLERLAAAEKLGLTNALRQVENQFAKASAERDSVVLEREALRQELVERRSRHDTEIDDLTNALKLAESKASAEQASVLLEREEERQGFAQEIDTLRHQLEEQHSKQATEIDDLSNALRLAERKASAEQASAHLELEAERQDIKDITHWHNLAKAAKQTLKAKCDQLEGKLISVVAENDIFLQTSEDLRDKIDQLGEDIEDKQFRINWLESTRWTKQHIEKVEKQMVSAFSPFCYLLCFVQIHVTHDNTM